MEKKKPFVYRTNTRNIIHNMQRDFSELNDKQEMVAVGELRDAQSKNYLKRLFSFLEKAKKEFKDDFLIEVFQWHEVGDRKIKRIRLRQILALPTPRPGRAYYYYHAIDDSLDLLWDLPPKKACEWAYKNRHTFGIQMPEAMKTILDYYDGSLTGKADEINKNIADHRRSYYGRRIQH